MEFCAVELRARGPMWVQEKAAVWEYRTQAMRAIVGHGKEFGLYSNSKTLPNVGHSHGTPSVLCLEVVVLTAVGLADCTQGMPGSQVGYQLIPWVILWLLYVPAFLCLSEGFSRTKDRRTLVHFITWVRARYLLAMKTENKLEFN